MCIRDRLYIISLHQKYTFWPKFGTFVIVCQCQWQLYTHPCHSSEAPHYPNNDLFFSIHVKVVNIFHNNWDVIMFAISSSDHLCIGASGEYQRGRRGRVKKEKVGGRVPLNPIQSQSALQLHLKYPHFPNWIQFGIPNWIQFGNCFQTEHSKIFQTKSSSEFQTGFSLLCAIKANNFLSGAMELQLWLRGEGSTFTFWFNNKLTFCISVVS